MPNAESIESRQIEHIAWCAENQREKLLDFGPEIATLARELLSLRRENEWISVEDRLPERLERVLVYCKWGTYCSRLDWGFDNKPQWEIGGTGAGYLPNVTLWRPLPAPPTGKD